MRNEIKLEPLDGRLRNRLLAITVLLLYLGSLASGYFGHSADRDVDFWVYYFSAKVVHDNPRGDLYRGNLDGNPQEVPAPADSPIAFYARAAGVGNVMKYIYPPLLADLLIPLARFSPFRAAAIWTAANIALILTALVLLARMLQIRVISFAFAVLGVCAFCFYPVHQGIWNGQVSIILMALCALSLFAYKEDWTVLSAVALALATVLKITPVMALPLFVIWKDRRWLITYISSVAGILAALWAFNGPHNMYLSFETLLAMGPGIPQLGNKCISSLATWIYFGNVWNPEAVAGNSVRHLNELLVTIRSIDLVFYVACLVPVWMNRRRMDRSARVFAIAAFFVVALCVSPISWRHDYAIAVPALAIAWTYALRQRMQLAYVGVLAVITVATGTLFFDAAAQAMPMAEAARIALSGFWVVASIAFCIIALWRWNTNEHFLTRDGDDSIATDAA